MAKEVYRVYFRRSTLVQVIAIGFGTPVIILYNVSPFSLTIGLATVVALALLAGIWALHRLVRPVPSISITHKGMSLGHAGQVEWSAVQEVEQVRVLMYQYIGISLSAHAIGKLSWTGRLGAFFNGVINRPHVLIHTRMLTCTDEELEQQIRRFRADL